MKKRLIGLVSIFLVSILLLSNFASAYSLSGRVIDEVKMFFSGSEGKTEIALEIREKQIDSAIEKVKSGDKEGAIKDLEEAKEKLKLVQEKASPQVSDKIKLSVEEISKKIIESKDIDPEFKAYLEKYLTEEEKTKLAVELTEKLSVYCEELAKQSYELMEKDEKCNPENAPKWLKKDIEKKMEEGKEKAAGEMVKQLTTCMSDPRECNCDNIPIAEEKAKCEKSKALAIRCEFQNDNKACEGLKELKPEVPSSLPGFLKPIFQKTMDELITKKEKEMFNKFAPKECVEANVQTREDCEKLFMEKYAPRECIEANAKTKEECEKIMIAIHGPPPDECMENGEFIGPEACEEKMIKSGKIPQECIRDNKPIPREECEKIMQEKGQGPPQECIKNRKFVGEEECMKIMQEKGIPIGEIPEECIKEGKPVSPEECEKIMKEKGIKPPTIRKPGIGQQKIPQECVGLTFDDCEKLLMGKYIPKDCQDAKAFTPEACEKVMLSGECKEKGIFSREECEAFLIKKNMPQECIEKNALTPEECGKILSRKVGVSAGSEIDFLAKKGIKFEDIPTVCLRGSNFVRSMGCDKALAELGISLPPPADISNMPKECVKDNQPVTPQECEEILKNKIVNENIPGPCREAGITNPDDCGKFIENKRGEEGIGLNMPSECLGKSPEECRKIMEEKGIKLQLPTPVPEEKECEEGDEKCLVKKESPKEMPDECSDMGISDENSCGIVMSKMNEERMKNGDKMVVDEQGNKDYITQEQINKIAEESEKKAQELKPDLEKVEEVRKDIQVIEENIRKVEEKAEQISTQIEQSPSPPTEAPPSEAASSESAPSEAAPTPPAQIPSEAVPTTGQAIKEIYTDFFNDVLEKIKGVF